MPISPAAKKRCTLFSPPGRELEGKVVYIDADLDIALVKVAPTPAESELPHLTLADASTVHQGERVIAIGNPGEAMLFSVEKISSVSASNPSAGQSLDSPASPNAHLSTALEAVGTVSITSDPDGAEIFVDDKFHGNTPATLKLPAGSHAVVLKFPGHADWRRALEILKSSKTSLKAYSIQPHEL
jgi:PEGA domain-containing protein/trypsin-like peptidase